MDKIIIEELEVCYRVGVPDKERAVPQKLLLTIVMEHDFTRAAATDAIKKTIDYDTVVKRLTTFGKKRSWKLIETLAVEIAELILREFKPIRVTIEIKKFILPNTRHVAVQVTRKLTRRHEEKTEMNRIFI